MWWPSQDCGIPTGARIARNIDNISDRDSAPSGADPGDVMFDGLGRDEQLGTDVAIGHAEQQQLGDLALALRQRRLSGRRRSGGGTGGTAGLFGWIGSSFMSGRSATSTGGPRVVGL
jgi:hypothetical protein